MKLKKFKTDNFAGLRSREYEFVDGMNVLYGKNETGKSTIIDAVYNTLFQNAKLNRTTDKEFIANYFPVNSSDTIDSTIVFEVNNKKYQLKKSWGAKMHSELVSETGQRIHDQDNINMNLNHLFEFGSATYRYILFSSQKYPSPLVTIFTTDEIKTDVVNFLSKAVMELDGVSIDELEEGINDRISNLTNSWDIESVRPKNNRGINNPYKKNIGQILQSYYNKEYLKNDMQNALKSEQYFEQITKELGKVSKELKTISEQKKVFDDSSEDIRKRSELERDLLDIKKVETELKQVISKWPALEQKQATDVEKLEKLRIEQKGLNEELIKISAQKRRNELKEILSKIEKNEGERTKLISEREPLQNIKQELLKEAENLERNILINNGKLSASQLSAKLEVLDESIAQDINLYDAMNEKLEYLNSENFDLGGYLKLVVKDIVEFEVKLKELDVTSIIVENTEYKKRLNEIYKSMNVDTLDEAKLKYERKVELDNKIRLLDKEKDMLIGTGNLEEMKSEFGKLEEVKELRSKEEVDSKLVLIDREIRKLEIETATTQKELTALLEKYTSVDNAILMHGENYVKRESINRELNGLKKLPEGFTSADEFFDRAKRVNARYSELLNSETDIRIQYNKAEANLPEISYEELKRDLADKEEEFTRLLNRLNALERIRDVFHETKREMESNPISGLYSSMQKYLKRILGDSIRINKLQDELKVEFVNSEGHVVKYNHLSKGTKDTIALSLRLSLLENLFPKNSFIVLDDVLNDMDINRRKESIEMLKEFSNDYQVIFTTCDPVLAGELGGNLIEVV